MIKIYIYIYIYIIVCSKEYVAKWHINLHIKCILFFPLLLQYDFHPVYALEPHDSWIYYNADLAVHEALFFSNADFSGKPMAKIRRKAAGRDV